MTGIFLIIVILVWLGVAIWLSKLVTQRIEHSAVRWLISVLLFAVLMVAPVTDEIIGGYQFQELCQKDAFLNLKETAIRGQSVIAEVKHVDELLTGTAIPIRWTNFVYKKLNTDEILASYSVYSAKGGWFIHMLKISEGNAPLLFSGGCSPKGVAAKLANLDVKVVNIYSEVRK